MPPRIVLAVIVVLAGLAPAAAQTPQPYILGEVGGSFGDGGSVPAVALGFGYLTSRDVGFEIELSYLPDLDFGDPGIPRIAIFPPITIESSGRMLALQTHVIGVLPGGRTKLRAFVLAGGGVADIEQHIRVQRPFVLTVPTGGSGSLGTPGLPGVPDLSDIATLFESEHRLSDTNLVLSAGTGFEYQFTDHFGLGMSVRYQRVFSEPERLDMARAGARVTWRF